MRRSVNRRRRAGGNGISPTPKKSLPRGNTKGRAKLELIGNATSEKNRVEKILQDANVKLSSALSDIFGASGQLMLEALLAGKADLAEIASFAKCRAKQKIPEIIAALEGHRMSDHHRMMIRMSLEHLRFLERQIAELDEVIAAKIETLGLLKHWELLQTIPALQAGTAANVLAEVGPDMTQFPSEKHLGSWAGLCPGNNESAGKRKACKPTRGNRFLKAALTESAWGVSRKKSCFLKDKFWSVASKKQKKQPAVIAVAHGLLRLVYQVLKTGQPHRERDGIELEQGQKERIIRHHIRRLGRLGIPVRRASGPSTKPRRKTASE
jgi:transposase